MWLTSRHLEGGTAEIRFVVDGVGARVAYITAKKKKRSATADRARGGSLGRSRRRGRQAWRQGAGLLEGDLFVVLKDTWLFGY